MFPVRALHGVGILTTRKLAQLAEQCEDNWVITGSRSRAKRGDHDPTGGARKKHVLRQVLFLTMCSARAERDVHFVRDACFASDVHFAREDAEHITSPRPAGATSLCEA